MALECRLTLLSENFLRSSDEGRVSSQGGQLV